jgi:hypothetical protein
MKKFILFCLAILLSLPAFSQRDETALHNPGIKLTGFWGGGISRMHNFNSDHNYAHGSYFAFELNKNILIGWDRFTLKKSIPEIENIKMATNGIMLGYTYKGHKVIHPIANLSLGRAKTRIGNEEIVGSFAAKTSLGAEFNVFRWFRIAGEVGYRYIDDRGESFMKEANLSSPYVGLKLKFGWSWAK